MCGIFGYFEQDGAPPITDGDRISLGVQLALANESRGGHSWGIAAHSEETGDYRIARGLGHASGITPYVFDARRYMAHTRFATHGDKTVANAHPFEIGSLIGCHNGIIYNKTALDAQYPDRNFAVDSQHIFAHLDLGLSFRELEGYGSIQWVDRNEPNRIYLCRMRDGELAVRRLVTNYGRAIVWSSDERHVDDALAALDIFEFDEVRMPRGRVCYVEDGEIYQTTRKLKLSARPPMARTLGDIPEYRAFSMGASGLPGAGAKSLSLAARLKLDKSDEIPPMGYDDDDDDDDDRDVPPDTLAMMLADEADRMKREERDRWQSEFDANWDGFCTECGQGEDEGCADWCSRSTRNLLRRAERRANG